MRTRRRLGRITLLFLTGLIVLGTERAFAVEFAIIGARQMGMGGAGVAITTDALATYWNPAGLAMSPTVDIRIAGGVQGIDRMGVSESVKQINDLNKSDLSVDNLNRAQALANRLNQPGASLSAIAGGGLYIKGAWGHSAFGVNVSDVATGGAFVRSPITQTVSGGQIQVNGQLALRGLEARQAALSYAYAFAERIFAIGATVKAIQGAAYTGLVDVARADDIDNIKDSLGAAKLSTAISVDVGAVFRPTNWLRVGIVAKDINEPVFDAPDGSQFRLTSQVRGGIAVNPYSSLTLTVDGDITPNYTLIPGLKSRVISMGAEQTILAEFLSFRIGALKNVEDAKSIVTPTAGIGVRLFAFRLDIGGGYDFRERQVLAAGTIAFTF